MSWKDILKEGTNNIREEARMILLESREPQTVAQAGHGSGSSGYNLLEQIKNNPTLEREFIPKIWDILREGLEQKGYNSGDAPYEEIVNLRFDGLLELAGIPNW